MFCGTIVIATVYYIWCFSYLGVNLTAESNQGQVDAYVENAEWHLEGS